MLIDQKRLVGPEVSGANKVTTYGNQFSPFQDHSIVQGADGYGFQWSTSFHSLPHLTDRTTNPSKDVLLRFCVTEKTFKSHGLQKSWQVLSTNRDVNGMEFISSVEHYRRPFVGLQFHPEVNAFKWNPVQGNPHSHKAILSARHFYDWLVEKSRANNQSFSNLQEEHNSLFSNYCPDLMHGNTVDEYRAYFFY
ncbi:hypothetical protein J6590_004617 [Homalodisca vitripennis]|nr:hypothetical protein J6590_004617 [Homalodisca vitripennis]